MTNKKSTKKALVLSCLSLLLCMSMLVGTTFAWFTDSVSSAKNQIIAGNLDVELEYAKVVDGQMTDWATVAGAEDLFDPEALWEPGRVEVVYLKVSNLGTLVLKYQLGVNVFGENAGVNVAGEEFNLSDFLVFKAVEMPDALTTYTDRQAAQLASGSAMGLTDYNGVTTELEVEGVDYVALIVYMPESVGNEANYRGTEVPAIELGVNLYATQVEAEADSFGPDYDEDAWNTDMTVYTEADLLSALANGANVQLGADIVLTEAWTPVGTEDAPFNGNFDGNGYTISGLTIDADYAAMFAYLGAGATVKNLNLENVNVSGKHAAAVAYMANGAIIENVEVSGNVTSTKNYAAGVVVRGTGTTVKGCENNATIEGAYLGAGIAAWMPNATIEDCVNNGSVTGVGERAAGIVALVSGTVTNCTNNGDVTANGSMPAGGIVAVVEGATTIEGCTNSGNVTATKNSQYNASAAGILGHTPSAKVSIIDCVNTGNITSAYSVAAGIGVSQYGGITATNCSNSGDISGQTVKGIGNDQIVAAKGMFGGANTIN